MEGHPIKKSNKNDITNGKTKEPSLALNLASILHFKNYNTNIAASSCAGHFIQVLVPTHKYSQQWRNELHTYVSPEATMHVHRGVRVSNILRAKISILCLHRSYL